MKKETLVTSDAKRIVSAVYRKRVKKFVQMVKDLRGIDRVKNVQQRPTKNFKKQEAFDKTYATTLDKGTVHFWLNEYKFEETRRSSTSDKVDSPAKENEVKDSVKY